MMSVLDKAALINDFAAEFIESDNRELLEFFILNNLGVPFSIGVVNQYITLNKDGFPIIDETWHNLCILLNINPDFEYDNIDDMLDESDLDID